MPIFIKRPVEVEARCLTPETQNDILLWVNAGGNSTMERTARPLSVMDDDGCYHQSTSAILIETLEGEMKAVAGNWIIRGVQGEFYPCRADIFEATYELA